MSRLSGRLRVNLGSLIIFVRTDPPGDGIESCEEVRSRRGYRCGARQSRLPPLSSRPCLHSFMIFLFIMTSIRYLICLENSRVVLKPSSLVSGRSKTAHLTQIQTEWSLLRRNDWPLIAPQLPKNTTQGVEQRVQYPPQQSRCLGEDGLC